MKNFIFTSLIALCTVFLVSSCGKNNAVNCSSGFALGQAIVDEATALSNAASAYGMDPSAANCENYKQAYRDYIEELKRYRNCAYDYGQGAQYEEDLREAEEELDDLC